MLTLLFLITKELLKSGAQNTLQLSTLLPVHVFLSDRVSSLGAAQNGLFLKSMERLFHTGQYTGNWVIQKEKKGWRDKSKFEKQEEGQNGQCSAEHILVELQKGRKKQTCIKQQKGKVGKPRAGKSFLQSPLSPWPVLWPVAPVAGCSLFSCTYIPELEAPRDGNGEKPGVMVWSTSCLFRCFS